MGSDMTPTQCRIGMRCIGFGLKKAKLTQAAHTIREIKAENSFNRFRIWKHLQLAVRKR
jgi:hypothetical protein